MTSSSPNEDSLPYDQRINPLYNINMCIVLIHGGSNHNPSTLALNRWHYFKNRCRSENSSIVDCLGEVEVVDNRVKQWLRSNTMGIVVDRIPSILIRRSGNKTIVYDIEHLDRVMSNILEH